MKSKIVSILRWILFLPATALGSWLIYVIFTWMNHTIPIFNVDSVWNHLIDIVGQCIFGGAFVAIGTYVAPKGRKIVAIILFAVLCMIDGIAFTGNLGHFSWWHLIGELFTLLGGGHFVYVFFNEDEVLV